jgi:hypothetical protein
VIYDLVKNMLSIAIVGGLTKAPAFDKNSPVEGDYEYNRVQIYWCEINL